MGGASAPPFFRHFPFKNGDLGAHPGKICLPLILISLLQIFLSLPLSKTKRRVGKIWRRKVFPKVKNVNVESPKKRSKLLFFWRALSPFLSINTHEWVHQGGFHFLEHELIVWTRIEQGLNKNCSELMRHLMGQLMGINGETFLAGSAPFLNPFWNINVHEFDSLKSH